MAQGEDGFAGDLLAIPDPLNRRSQHAKCASKSVGEFGKSLGRRHQHTDVRPVREKSVAVARCHVAATLFDGYSEVGGDVVVTVNTSRIRRDSHGGRALGRSGKGLGG